MNGGFLHSLPANPPSRHKRPASRATAVPPPGSSAPSARAAPRASRARQVPEGFRCGSAATKGPTELGSLFAGQSDAAALASFLTAGRTHIMCCWPAPAGPSVIVRAWGLISRSSAPSFVEALKAIIVALTTKPPPYGAR